MIAASGGHGPAPEKTAPEMAGPEELAKGVLAGRPRPIARAISEVERDSGDVPEILRRVFSQTGRARIIGITGPPGAGKSTLVLRLAQAYRREGKTVGVVAASGPTSKTVAMCAPASVSL